MNLLSMIINRLHIMWWVLLGNVIVCYEKETGNIIGAITDEGTLTTDDISMQFVDKEYIDTYQYRVKIEELKGEKNE